MDLSRSLVKEFADIANNKNAKEKPSIYVRGTVKMVGTKKFVQLDGSDALTPLTETVDVQDKDRILVAIENHTATVMGNFTFPPSARKEQEAVDKADNAQNSANDAVNKAEDAQNSATNAGNKADQAIEQAGKVEGLANDAKENAQQAIDAANKAEQNAADAKQSATNADLNAQTARGEAEKAQQAAANAQGEVAKINKEVDTVKGDISGALTELGNQAAEIEATKQTMELNYAKKTDVSSVEASLKTEISTKVGELKTTVEETYAAKTEIVEMEGKLQTQITQNAQGLTSQAGRVEKLEADTIEAQKQVDIALDKAASAQSSADKAQADASLAQTAADLAKENAATAATKADAAKTAADAANAAASAADAKVQSAQADLNEAKQNLTNVTNRVGATEQEIADAQAKVDAAQISVDKALADAAEANLAATNAKNAADKAQTDAANAQLDATNAQKKADSASLAADKAQQAADQAQKDVAALTSKVTAAETQIKQNSEAISLEASKREEIGTKLDNVELDLKNNYYSKTETDAKLKVESDRISSTVSKVETVEKSSITSNVEEFYSSTSPTTLTGGSWSTTQPTWTQGKYIWRRTLVTKGDGTTSYTPSQNGVCITGNTGNRGPQGLQGPTGENGADLSNGTMLFTDPTFAIGVNNTTKYANTGGEYLKYERLAKSVDNPFDNTEYEMVITNTGQVNPNIGGFKFSNQTRSNAVFIYRVIAKIPEGRNIAWAANSGGDGAKAQWLTPTNGTGKFEEYLLKFTCGSTGTFSTIGFFYVNGSSGTTYNPVKWYVAYATCFDMTSSSDSLYAKDTADEGKQTADEALSKATDNESKVTISMTKIEQLDDQISALVTDENGNSLMIQDSSGWHFNIGAIQNTLNNAVKDLSGLTGDMEDAQTLLDATKGMADALEKKTAFIDLTTVNGQPAILLGQTNSKFKLRITNTSIDFLEGTEAVAYISNQNLYITRAIIKDEIQIGDGTGWVLKRRPNGNLGLRWMN